MKKAKWSESSLVDRIEMNLHNEHYTQSIALPDRVAVLTGGWSFRLGSGSEQIRQAVGKHRLDLAHRFRECLIPGQDRHHHAGHGDQSVGVP